MRLHITNKLWSKAISKILGIDSSGFRGTFMGSITKYDKFSTRWYSSYTLSEDSTPLMETGIR